ncbi:MAG: peptidoglycan editing factor PgeF [Anaerolineales bacterium]|nr:peptidoglycan editing factor PgeF [Anaerolineales bacterium]
MPFISEASIRYYQFNCFPDEVIHAVFTRSGGVSPAPWNSLNLGGMVGDDMDRVRENRFRAFDALKLARESIFDVWQVHGTNVVIARQPRQTDIPYQQADIIVTDRPGVTLFMRFADCVPLLLVDPKKKIIGLAHAGWMGTVRNVAAAAVDAICKLSGSKPADLLAAIGPSIGPDHYIVGPDVVISVLQSFENDADGLLDSRNGHVYFNLWAANQLQLEKAGLENIETAGLCTACHEDDWFSHRAQKGNTGRFGVLMALKDQD